MKKQFIDKPRRYYYLTKPGIIRGNAYSATAGFFLATTDQLELALYMYMIMGVSLVIASGCVFNNYIDRGIDKYMERTKKRSLITGSISANNALVYGSTLGTLGFLILALWVNELAALVAFVGFVFYVGVYAVAKRKSVHGTAVGSISGAIPPVIGYVAVSNRLTAAALILFLILVLWQMPHFFAISIYRIKEYKAAGLPVLPIKKGVLAAKRQIVGYIIAFSIVSPLLVLLGYTGALYLISSVTLSLYWLITALRGFSASSDTLWAQKVFRVSLVVLSTLCGVIVLEKLLRLY